MKKYEAGTILIGAYWQRVVAEEGREYPDYYRTPEEDARQHAEFETEKGGP